MKNDVSQRGARLAETAKAIEGIRGVGLRTDLLNQLQHAEAALAKKDMKRAAAYLQALVTAALMLRSSLREKRSTLLLNGILEDSYNLRLALPLLDYSKDKRCVFNTGSCAPRRNRWCVKIDNTWGCGTTPRGPWVVSPD
jgi:hypothetical protein